MSWRTSEIISRSLIMDNNFDVIIVGSGPGGYVCAIRCAQLGLKTACVESSKTLGGTCLNVGCIPSKSLLNSSEMYHMANHKFGNLGIEAKEIKLNLEQMMKNKDKSVATLTKGIEYLFKKNKITHLKGKGLISDKETVSVVDGNVEVRPIMYLALSYDHRIIDGKEAVSFLKIVKESLEQPKRLFLNI